MVIIKKSKRLRSESQFFLTFCFSTFVVLISLFCYSFYRLHHEMQNISISIAKHKRQRIRLNENQIDTLTRTEDPNSLNGISNLTGKDDSKSLKQLLNCDKCGLICNAEDPAPFREKTFVAFAGTKFQKVRQMEIKKQVPGIGWESGCVISHKYKFIYIHVLKAGGTSTKRFLREGLCGSPKSDGDCPDGEEVFSVRGRCTDMIRENQEYFVWSFVRNPFHRMYSAYSMAMGPGFKIKDATFDEYVLGVDSRKVLTRMSPSHVGHQNRWLFDNEGCPNFDFIGRLENFEEDMSHILEVIGSDELNSLFEANGNTVKRENLWGFNKKKKQGCGYKEIYKNPEVVEYMSQIYFRDFHLLGYNPDIVPDA